MNGRNLVRRLLGTVGSLWFAAVLLLLAMVALGSATVSESMRGTELAGALFYHARWFRMLLALMGVNIAAAVATRYPFSRRLVPFLLAHVGILVIFGGALVTHSFGIDGQLTLEKGETASSFLVSSQTLTLKAADGTATSLDLGRAVGRGVRRVELADVGELALKGVRARPVRYLPDVAWEKRITNDNPDPQLGFEVGLEGNGKGATSWLLTGTHGEVGGYHADIVQVETAQEWEVLSAPQDASSIGRIRVTVGGATEEMPAEACTDHAVPIKGTPYSVRLKQYLPHAVVGPDRKSIVSASDRPVNPAVEVEVAGPEGKDSRLAFAKFPDFHGRQGATVIADLKVLFTSSVAAPPAASIELLSGPNGELAVRFGEEGATQAPRELRIGQPVKTPWPGQTLALLTRFDHARVSYEPVEQTPIRMSRQPALLVKVSDAEESEDFWVGGHSERRFVSDNDSFVLAFGDRSIPLGFNVTLKQFRIGHYPGGQRPRSFESSVRIVDPGTGVDRDTVISMNHPATQGGYIFYQSSYRGSGDDYATVLSVSRDPGRLIVFIGYSLVMAGMAGLLVQRLRIPRRKDPDSAASDKAPAAEPQEV